MTEENPSASEPIAVGRVAGAYGLRGEVRVAPFAGGEALLASRRWFFTPLAGGPAVEWRLSAKARRHGTWILGHPECLADKESADRCRGTVAVLREDFPRTKPGEYWASDLIGCAVVNVQGETLGTVTKISDNGVQDILQLTSGEGRTLLIPVIPQFVHAIRPEERRILVDWQADWS